MFPARGDQGHVIDGVRLARPPDITAQARDTHDCNSLPMSTPLFKARAFFFCAPLM